MLTTPRPRPLSRLLAATLACVAAAGTACGADSYDPATAQLTIPTLTLGGATYSTMVITVGAIVSGPQGTAPLTAADSYNPALNQLTVPAVVVAGKTYYNVVVTVGNLVSIGGVTGADTFDGAHLTMPLVQTGGKIYRNVVASVGPILSVAGGFPGAAPDTYNTLTRALAVGTVAYAGHVYTNVVVTGGSVVSAAGVYATASEANLHSFTGTDGATPFNGLVQGSDGNFYGTTSGGGAHSGGTAFVMTPAGVVTVLHSFGAVGDGISPAIMPLVQGSDGNFYGTTIAGGAYGQGTVFLLTPGGTETPLYSFAGGVDGAQPYGGVIFGSDGNLYGTTYAGGQFTYGTFYRVTPAGVETVLHDFGGSLTDGAQPRVGVVLGKDLNFYGTTYTGGQSGNGTVYQVTSTGTETPLYAFTGGVDGGTPSRMILASDGNFYGTTVYGGAHNVGAVFRFSPTGGEAGIYSFSGTFGPTSPVGTVDGANPNRGLIEGSDGNLYGTTFFGGTYDEGTVFKVTRTGVETVVYSFSGNGSVPNSTDGAHPAGLMQARDGSFYGTTVIGGANTNYSTSGNGAIFRLSNVIP